MAEETNKAKRKSETYWNDQSVKFSTPSLDDYTDIVNIFLEDFIPDEPVLRSIDLLGGNWWIDRYVHKLVLEDVIESAIKSPTSIIARNNAGNIVGFRLGKIYDVSTPVPYEPSLLWTLTCPLWIPKRLVALGLDQLYFEKVGYGIDKAFKQINCNSKIYFGQAVCAGKEMRGKGLGPELVLRSHELAKDNGCEFSYLMATGVYSQSMFKKLGYKVINEVSYAEMLDPNGHKIVWDHREHKSVQLLYFKH